jgi:hypothetical protein
MTVNGLLQIALYFGLTLLLIRPLGRYMARVYNGERTWLDPALRPVERIIYWISGIKPQQEQHWTTYTAAMLLFNLSGMVLLYTLQRIQHVLPLNPQHFDPVSPDLAFNTAVSFTSNTNWQAYAGESTMSYLVQMAGLTVQNFLSAAKEAGNMVDLDSNPTKLLEIVEIGKQLLITRGALTTFSIANDVAKYFAIIPAMFVATYPELAALNVMRLATPQSAILSAVIFNALIIIALIPLALRGVRYRPKSAVAILRRNLLIYGVGGVIIPFIGIKAIDVVLVALRIA